MISGSWQDTIQKFFTKFIWIEIKFIFSNSFILTKSALVNVCKVVFISNIYFRNWFPVFKLVIRPPSRDYRLVFKLVIRPPSRDYRLVLKTAIKLYRLIVTFLNKYDKTTIVCVICNKKNYIGLKSISLIIALFLMKLSSLEQENNLLIRN